MDSKPPLPMAEIERMLGLDKDYEPVPDDDTPTSPDMDVCASCLGEKLTPACRDCLGTGKRH